MNVVSLDGYQFKTLVRLLVTLGLIYFYLNTSRELLAISEMDSAKDILREVENYYT